MTVFRDGLTWARYTIQEKESSFFEEHPDKYERIITAFHKRQEIGRAIGEIINFNFRDNSPNLVVDAACGTGIIANEIAQLTASDTNIIGCDFSNPALQYAEKTKDKKIKWVNSDLLSIPTDDESVDVYTMVGGYRFVKDAEKYYQEINRVLKKSGFAVIPRIYFDMHIWEIYKAKKICEELNMGVLRCRLNVKKLFNRLTAREALLIWKKGDVNSK